MLSDLRFRLRALFQRRLMERELDDELRFHVERETEKYVRAGIPRAEAERRARVAFGGVERIKEDARDVRGVSLADAVGQDLRYAWRGLRAKPGFTAAVVVTIGLGVGANAAMFGIVDRLLFRPPAFLRDAAHTHRVYLRYQTVLEERVDGHIQYTRFADLRRWTTSFDRAAAMSYRRFPVGVGENAREMQIGAVSAAFFDFFDAPPVLGRYFVADEDKTPSGAPVVVLSEDFWRTKFGGDRSILGTPIQIGPLSFTVIGVAPEGFVGIPDGAAPVAFIPITTFAFARSPDYFQNYNWSWLEMVVRRKPGVSVSAANADLTNAYRRSWAAEAAIGPVPAADSAKPRAEIASVHLGRGPQASSDAKVVGWVMGVAAIVLLVACANVANLLLARALRRRREIALRLALGVTRRRLFQQLLTESLLLATLGGVAGVLVAQWGGRALRAFFLPEGDPGGVVTDVRTLAFAAAVTLVVALLTGVVPTTQTLRQDLATALKAGTREGTYRRSRLRSGLLLFQGALSVVLLVGAGLFLRSLLNVRSLRLGYDIAPVVYVEGNMRGMRLPPAESFALAERLRTAAEATPGVRSASLAVSVPFWSNESRGVPFVPGVDSVRKLGRFLLQAGSPSYFETLGTRILRGRAFTAADRAGSERVLLITESMANALWPGQDAIGKRLRFGRDTTPFSTVVGIVEDMRARQLNSDREFWYYMPMEQYVAYYGEASPTLFARVDGKAKDFAEQLRRRLQREMPGASYVTAMPLQNLVAPMQRSWQFGATMFLAFGGLALVLAAIGLYSVIAYAVAQRTHELGVRIALGASTGDVIRLVVFQGVAFAVAGISIGSAIALYAGSWVEPLLFSQKARDPLVFGVVAAILLLAAIAATLRPAIRAGRVDPTVALRSD